MRAPRRGERFDVSGLTADPEAFDSVRLNLVHKRAWCVEDSRSTSTPSGTDGRGNSEDTGEGPDYAWDIPLYVARHEGKRPLFSNDVNRRFAKFHHWAKRIAIRQAGSHLFLLEIFPYETHAEDGDVDAEQSDSSSDGGKDKCCYDQRGCIYSHGELCGPCILFSAAESEGDMQEFGS